MSDSPATPSTPARRSFPAAAPSSRSIKVAAASRRGFSAGSLPLPAVSTSFPNLTSNRARAFARRAGVVAMLFFASLCGPSRGEAQVFVEGELQIDVDQFDSWVFNQYGNASSARESLEARIGIKIRRLEQSLTLREDQKKRLQLAGQGDINRFFNRVAQARSEFRQLVVDRNNLNDAYQLAAPLQQELTTGLFEDGSLFAKVLRGTLEPEQRERLEKHEQERRQRQLENHAKSFVGQLETQIPLTAVQRERLVALTVERAGNANPDSPYFVYVLNYHLSQLPEEEMEGVLDAGQLRVFRKVQAQHAGMAPFLRQQGLLDELDE